MTREQILEKLTTLGKEREQLLLTANMALGKIDGAIAVWTELLAELDKPKE